MTKKELRSHLSERADTHEDLFDLVSQPSTSVRRMGGVSVGKLCGFNASGAPLVDFPENVTGAPAVARTTITPELSDVGREVVLLFESGDPRRPILVGCLLQPRPPREVVNGAPEVIPREVELDGERLVFTAKQEIVLRCGNASVTLTRAGKVLIRGAYLLSRSSGVNRIKGGSVQIN
jgi:hypothetical protein